jgi:hypothetical protein
MSVRGCLNWVGLLAVVVGLPLAVHRLRGNTRPRCAFDDKAVGRTSRVDVVDAEGRPHVFCCPSCAMAWLVRRPDPPRSVTVTDEASGQPLDADQAVYVRSSEGDERATGLRLHAYRSRADAERHADSYMGVVLTESERPFRR